MIRRLISRAGGRRGDKCRLRKSKELKNRGYLKRILMNRYIRIMWW